jgi:hypothetical protein
MDSDERLHGTHDPAESSEDHSAQGARWQYLSGEAIDWAAQEDEGTVFCVYVLKFDLFLWDLMRQHEYN